MEEEKIALPIAVDTSEPLKTHFKDKMLFISLYNNDLLSIDEKLSINLLVKFDVITSHFKNNQYTCDYLKLTTKKENFVEFSKVILKIDDYFLVLNFEFNLYLKIILNDNSFFIDTDDKEYFKITVQYYQNLDDLYTKVNFLTNFRIGLILDYDYYKKKINFSLIKDIIRFNTIILRNRDKIEDFQSFKEILKINDIDCILNYNLENSNDNEHNLIKNRDNSDYIYDNKKYIDYFSQSGRDTLANKISDIFNEGHIGLNIENIILKSDSIDDSDKIVVKSENNIIQYNKNIKVAIKKINSIFKETVNKDKIIYSDLYNSDLVDFIYFHDMKGDIKSFYHFIGDFFHQGYNKIAFYISQRPKNYHILLSILFSSGFYIDFNLLKKIINNKNFISKLQNIIDYRDSLQIYLKNINGLLFEIFYFKNILSGFFIGKSLYIGFIKKYLFQNYFSLPDCRLYCIEENKVVSGQVLYYFNKKQNDFLSFQAENSMIPFKKNNKIIFSIFVNMTSTFAVNDLSTNYNFDIIIDNKTIVIDFVSTMITNYEIELDFVIKDYKIKTILLGDKKILINKKNDIAVISFINDKKKTNIKIVFELN